MHRLLQQHLSSCNHELWPLNSVKVNQHANHHTTHTTVLRPFFQEHPGELVPEENFWTLWQGKINRGKNTDHPAGHQSIRTNQCPPPPSSQSPSFTGWMPFLPPNQQCQSTEGNNTFSNHLLDFYSAREDNRGRWTSMLTIQVKRHFTENLLSTQWQTHKHTHTGLIALPGPLKWSVISQSCQQLYEANSHLLTELLGRDVVLLRRGDGGSCVGKQLSTELLSVTADIARTSSCIQTTTTSSTTGMLIIIKIYSVQDTQRNTLYRRKLIVGLFHSYFSLALSPKNRIIVNNCNRFLQARCPPSHLTSSVKALVSAQNCWH